MLRINVDGPVAKNLFMRLCIAVLAAGALFSSPAITRWSTLQLVPDADMLPGGRFVVDADLAWNFGKGEFEIASPVSVQRVYLGLSEWVGLDVGYAGGFTMGLKTSLLKDNPERWYVPSLAAGFRNMYTSREAFYFDKGDGYPRNEFYVAAAKSSDWAKLRGHVGVMSAITGGGGDRFNPFFGFEKYFGMGTYVTLEAQRRSKDFLLSVFAVFRPVTDKLEVNFGLIDAPGMFQSVGDKPFRPMLRAGIKVHLGSGFDGFDGLSSVEDRVDRQRGRIGALERRVDSLDAELRWNADRIHELAGFPDERKEDRARVMDELAKLRNLYDQDPFDPEIVKDMVERVRERYEMFAPHLRVIITEPDVDLRTRRIAVSLIGEIGDKSASNILLSILNRFEEPAIKIQTMITLGKLQETRARDALIKLRGDQDGGVAFTAAEVYRGLFGTEDDPARDMLKAVEDQMHNTVPERRIGD
ncbi:MAG: hypothetical protein FWB85_09235 [Chitinispirillia bacterium]|nr:hypothetical protein [Chitinispirillia bacterium]MCL2242380.1 hypothetical protein [Chitinispirillia bacterium]